MIKKAIQTFIIFSMLFTVIYVPLNKEQPTLILKAVEYPTPEQERALVVKRTQSFVRIETKYKIGDEEVVAGYGSGVVIGHSTNGTVVMTNAHVCEDDKIRTILYGPARKYIRTLHNKEYRIYIVRMHVEYDICIIHANNVKLPKVPIAKEGPKVGEKVYNISAPKGIYFPEDGVVPIILGVYNGMLKDGALYTMRIAPGSSGSAIFNSRGELIGLVKAYFPMYDSLSLGVTLKQIRHYLFRETL